MRLKDYARHNCEIQAESASCLPTLPPYSGKCRRFIQSFRKWLTVNKMNRKAPVYFRSTAAIIFERRRQIHTVPAYVIHPFSKFSVYVEIIMSLTWFSSYFVDMMFIGFFQHKEYLLDYTIIISMTTNVLQMIYVVVCSITGYQITKTKEVVLVPGKIFKHYLRTYFFVDLLGAIPFLFILLCFNVKMDVLFFKMVHCTHLLKFIRIRTALQFFRQVTLILRIGDNLHSLLVVVLLTMVNVNWWTCVIYFVHTLTYYVNQKLDDNSWIYKSEIPIYNKSLSWTYKYLICLHKAVCHFHTAGIGMNDTSVATEGTILSFVTIAGSIHYMYCLVKTFQLMRSSYASETKYEQFLIQLNDYMRTKNLPLTLRHRIISYYEHRFKKKFFREQAILSTLSDHLRLEVFLHSCRYLLEKVALFHSLPKQVVGTILATLKQEIFLPNDVVIKMGTECYSMYFISYGTVARYTSEGYEISHLEDGDHFGAVNLIRNNYETYQYNIVAIELTECYRWDKADFQKCMSIHEHVAEDLNKFIRTVHHTQMAEIRGVLGYASADILFELRNDRIIETGRRRR